MKGKGPDKPTTAILIGTNGSDVGHKAKARPWSEGPAKQFGLGPGPKRGGYADFDKKERTEQTEGLLTFYEMMHGPKWLVNDGWQDGLVTRRMVGCETVNPGDFHGVELAKDGAHVADLELPRNEITGPLHGEVFSSLAHLVSCLARSSGAAVGAQGRGRACDAERAPMNLPACLTCRHQVVLRLNGNRLKRALGPDLGTHCPALRDLDLSNNLFTGSLPATLNTMPELVFLRLQDNRFTGPLPRLDAARNTMEVVEAA